MKMAERAAAASRDSRSSKRTSAAAERSLGPSAPGGSGGVSGESARDATNATAAAVASVANEAIPAARAPVFAPVSDIAPMLPARLPGPVLRLRVRSTGTKEQGGRDVRHRLTADASDTRRDRARISTPQRCAEGPLAGSDGTSGLRSRVRERTVDGEGSPGAHGRMEAQRAPGARDGEVGPLVGTRSGDTRRDPRHRRR